MFKRLADTGARVAITVDGKQVAARAGDTVAAALIAALCSRSTRPGPPPQASTARPPQNLYLPFSLKACRP